MSQTPVPLRPKAKRSMNWKKPAPAEKVRRPPLRERLTHLRGRPGLRQTALALALCVLAGCYAAMPPQSAATAVVASKRVLPVYSVEREDDVIAVTFDASWGAENTPKLLDILDEYDAKCTFFLVGLWVDKYPEMVQAIVERGHEIGNHSDTHPHMTQISREKMLRELRMMSDKVEKLTTVRPNLFRPPYGDYNNQVIQVARDAGYEAVQWSVDSLDWKNISPEDMIRRAGKVEKGDIILFHNDSQYLLDALPTLLKHYQEQGLKMVKISDILLEGETTIDVQGKQHPIAAKDTTKER